MERAGIMLRNEWVKRSLVVWLGLVVCSLTACSIEQVNAKSFEKSAGFLKADEQDIQRWREMKFGLFIHWGPVSLKGTEIGWSRGGERRGRTGRGSIPVEIYDNLYKQFNPVKFNADEWVQTAKDAGMKYLVFTSKHHDGFSMFDSQLTDYKITNSPFKRDVVKELADACHKAGLKLGYYYSPPDWYHPDYRTENHPRYIRFLHGQLREICSNYGKIDIIWFDGLGGKAEDWDSENLFRMIRQFQPHVIINNRAGLPADHDTPEQRIGKFQNDRPWETCMTICRQWAWKPNDQMKSLKQCIDTLVRVVGGDGNLLFNVGPMPDGRIEPRQVERLKEMGAWLKKYGDGVYGTRGGPFKPGKWGASTCKGDSIYLYVMNWHAEGKLVLPPIRSKLVGHQTLSAGEARVTQHGYGIEIDMPVAQQDSIATVIKLKVKGKALDIEPVDVPEEPAYLHAKSELIRQWQDKRFGMFIHWGPVSLKGTEIGWSRKGPRRGRKDKRTGSIPVEIYDNLYKQFNPVKFNADEWAQIAKDAGMKYMVFTSKHHDGFSMFDTRQTDYKITSKDSPYGKDVCKQLADACHRHGLGLGWYYSPRDWYHPDFATKNHQKYLEFYMNQLRELCTNYGKVDILWFDGLDSPRELWGDTPVESYKMLRTLQPDIILNNRGGLPGDFHTPEQRVGEFDRERPWETCMTICRQWAWKPNDQMKSLEQCIQTLIKVVGGDGNLLFNVGPMPNGLIEPRQVTRLKEMGNWLDKYGRSIYATRGGPFKPGNWGASTHKGNTIYVHVLNWNEDTLTLPPIPKNIIASSVMTGGAATVRQTRQAIEISVPKAYRRELDTIIVLELDGPANEISPRGLLSSSLTATKKAKASNVFQKNTAYGPAKAVDDDLATRWATDTGTKQAWLEVDLGKPMTFNRVKISEDYDRVREFELQCRDGSRWKTFARGTKLGFDYSKQFEPVTARYVRLNILDATDGPTIWEFQLFAPKK